MIHTTLDPHWRRETSPEIEAGISRAWAEASADAVDNHRLLFPGAVCRVLGYEVHPDRLNLSLGQSDYRQFLGTRTLDDPACRTDPLAVCAALVTADSKIIVGRRSQRNVEDPGVWHLIAGHVDPTLDGSSGQVDVFHAISREIEEEVGYAARDLSLICLGMVRWRSLHKYELLFAARTPRTSAELRRPADDEHDKIRLIDDNPLAIREFLDEAADNIVAAGQACLIRYASWRFGVAL